MTHSSGLVEKTALIFHIEIGNQLTTFNGGEKENTDEDAKNNTNKQSNNCSNSDIWWEVTKSLQSAAVRRS